MCLNALQFMGSNLSLYIYIYIYVCVCACVCACLYGDNLLNYLLLMNFWVINIARWVVIINIVAVNSGKQAHLSSRAWRHPFTDVNYSLMHCELPIHCTLICKANHYSEIHSHTTNSDPTLNCNYTRLDFKAKYKIAPQRLKKGSYVTSPCNSGLSVFIKLLFTYLLT